jgi:peroxiredoxin
MRTWLVVPLLLVLASCGESARQIPATGDLAPGFIAQRIDGRQVNVPHHLAGKVVAIRFWADWCPYCRPEMAALVPAYVRLRERGLEYLAVNVAQDRERVSRFVDDLGIPYPVLLDPEGKIARAYGVSALPVTWFIDREGRLRGKIVGESTPDVFERRALELLTAPERNAHGH